MWIRTPSIVHVIESMLHTAGNWSAGYYTKLLFGLLGIILCWKDGFGVVSSVPYWNLWHTAKFDLYWTSFTSYSQYKKRAVANVSTSSTFEPACELILFRFYWPEGCHWPTGGYGRYWRPGDGGR